MKKVLFIAVTLAVCILFGAGQEWAGFAAVYLLMTPKPLQKSLLWEIPMGVLICVIARDAFTDDHVMLIRVLIPIGAALFAGFYPKKLFLFFVIAISALYLKNIYSIAFLCATLWCGTKYVFVKNNSTIKRALLQGNNLTIQK